MLISHMLVGGVGDRGGPVKTLSKRITHEGSWCGVMTASASMDVTDQVLALGDGDASPEGLRLYSSSSIRTKGLARLARRRT